MKITKSELIDGLSRFVDNEVLPNIPERNIKIIIATAVGSLKVNPALIDKVWSHPIFAMLAPAEDGKHDVDQMLSVLHRVVQGNGEIEVTIPKIPLISKEEAVLAFGDKDINTLREYMVGGK